MTKVHFCSFGDSQRYSNSIQRINDEATNTGWFDSVTVFTELTLREAFRKVYLPWMRVTKGFGYWIWKAQVIRQMMEREDVSEGDIIVYIDSGCYINPRGEERFKHYVNSLQESEHSVLGFQLPYVEKQWSKMDLLESFSENIRDSNQLVGGLFMIKKNSKGEELVREWQQTMSKLKLIDDSPSKTTNDPTFKEHRHDQSVWSCIRKKYGCVLFEDETWHEDWNSEWIMSKPFHAKRIRC